MNTDLNEVFLSFFFFIIKYLFFPIAASMLTFEISFTSQKD